MAQGQEEDSQLQTSIRLLQSASSRYHLQHFNFGPGRCPFGSEARIILDNPSAPKVSISALSEPLPQIGLEALRQPPTLLQHLEFWGSSRRELLKQRFNLRPVFVIKSYDTCDSHRRRKYKRTHGEGPAGLCSRSALLNCRLLSLTAFEPFLGPRKRATRHQVRWSPD